MFGTKIVCNKKWPEQFCLQNHLRNKKCLENKLSAKRIFRNTIVRTKFIRNIICSEKFDRIKTTIFPNNNCVQQILFGTKIVCNKKWSEQNMFRKNCPKQFLLFGTKQKMVGTKIVQKTIARNKTYPQQHLFGTKFDRIKTKMVPKKMFGKIVRNKKYL